MVYGTARRMAKRSPYSADELISYGVIAMLEHYDRFDAARGVKFRTFMQHRVTGAMMDATRAACKKQSRIFGLSDDEPVIDESLTPDELVDSHIFTHAMLAKLTDKERAVVVRTLIDGDTLAQVGRDLGITESRVCQIRTTLGSSSIHRHRNLDTDFLEVNMGLITITITADEDDLRECAKQAMNWKQGRTVWIRMGDAIAGALPKPRIHPQPGDVLRRKRWGTFSLAARPHGSDGEVWIAGYGLLTSGLDPDEWEIVTAAELAELFEKKSQC